MRMTDWAIYYKFRLNKMTSDKNPLDNMQNYLNQLHNIVSGVMHAAQAQTLEAVLERIAYVAQDMLKVKYVALGVPKDTSGLEYFKVAGISEEEIEQIPHHPKGLGLIGAVMDSRETIRLEDMKDDPRSFGFPENHPHMKTFLGTPIQVGQQLFGMLYVSDRKDGTLFTDDDELLLETIASYAALAIAESRLRDERQNNALLRERERISMELHDGVIQSLYAIGMHLDLTRAADTISKEDLDVSISELNQVIEDIRSYIMNLKRMDQTTTTIKSCLQDLVRRLHIPQNVEVHISAPDEAPLFSLTILEAICQIINEALSNAIRHAEATWIQISAEQTERHFIVLIQDNGRGFDLENVKGSAGGLGLPNIQQRALIHGGSVDIATAIGEGTSLTIRIPVKK